MDRQLIKTLIDALQACSLEGLEYSRNGETLRLSKGSMACQASLPPVSEAPARPPRPPAAVPTPAALPPSRTDQITAPLYGVVHLQRSPGAVPFVAIGQAIEAGHVLCTIEAMKVFTDVRAARSGTVGAILVTDGQEVEAGQVLVRLA